METLTNPSRRRLFSNKRTRKASNIAHLRLPWVKSEALFTDKCTQCHQCISACETKIITPDPNGFPRVDFSDGECTFCNKCIDSCEQPLFVEPERRVNTLNQIAEDEQKVQPWPAQLTLVTANSDQNEANNKVQNPNNSCLASNDIFCQSCGDECEVEAITFSYVKTDENGNQQMSVIPQPSIHLGDCTQCGACISNCPQDAINLTLNATINASHTASTEKEANQRASQAKG